MRRIPGVNGGTGLHGAELEGSKKLLWLSGIEISTGKLRILIKELVEIGRISTGFSN